LFFLVAALCENDETLDVMVKSKDTFVPLTNPHPFFEVNYMEVSKVQPKSWHATMAKLHDIQAQFAFNQTNVIHGVVVVHNEEEMFQLRGASTPWY
jgi:hypothetical protein